MKEEVKMYTVCCDNCGKLFIDDHMGYSAWGTFGDAWEYANESGWVHNDNDREKHYCPDCHFFDENDNIVINKDRTKQVNSLQSNINTPSGISNKQKDDIHEVLMNLNRGRLAVSQAKEQIIDLLENTVNQEK